MFDDRGRRARDVAPAALGAHVAARRGAVGARAPTRARPARRVDDPDAARALADANDWQRRLDRARAAFRPGHAADAAPCCSSGSARRRRSGSPSSSASPTARRRGCFERIVSPKTIDAEVDPMLRGSVAHSALHKFYAGLPKELGHDRVTPENVEAARRLPAPLPRRRAARRRPARAHRAAGGRARGEPLARSRRVRARRGRARRCELLPRRFEVSFGSDRSAPELQRGLPLGDGLYLSGKIDRIDVDPFSARGIVQDYKSGRTAHSAKQIDEELKLQIPLYMLVLRDLVGVEPLGGVYRALAGARAYARPAARRRAPRTCPVSRRATTCRRRSSGRSSRPPATRRSTTRSASAPATCATIRRAATCPSWCDLWTMCRIERP